MDCPDAYREALVRDFAAKAAPARAPGQDQGAEADHAGAAGWPERHGTKSGRDAAENRGTAAASARPLRRQVGS